MTIFARMPRIELKAILITLRSEEMLFDKGISHFSSAIQQRNLPIRKSVGTRTGFQKLGFGSINRGGNGCVICLLDNSKEYAFFNSQGYLYIPSLGPKE
jgi:hypothetical protein